MAATPARADPARSERSAARRKSQQLMGSLRMWRCLVLRVASGSAGT